MTASGLWTIAISTPVGDHAAVLNFSVDGTGLTGFASGLLEQVPIEHGEVDGNQLRWRAKVNRPFPLNLEFAATVERDVISGTLKGLFGTFLFSGKRDVGCYEAS